MKRREAISTAGKLAAAGAVIAVVAIGGGYYILQSGSKSTTTTTTTTTTSSSAPPVTTTTSSTSSTTTTTSSSAPPVTTSTTSSSPSTSTTSTATSASSSNAKYGGTMTIASYSAVTNLDPTNGNVPGCGFFDNVFDTLLTTTYTQTSTPGVYTATLSNRLATSVTASTDGLTYTIKLQPNVLWHNGKPLTSADAVWTFNRLMPTSNGKSFLPYLTGATAVDDLTFTLTMSQAWAPTMAMLASYNQAIIPSLDTLGISQSDYNATMTYSQQANVIGTGPFKFAGQVVGSYEKLVRNPNYWMQDTDGSQLPYLDAITYNPVTDPNVRLTTFQSGAADFTHEIAPSAYSTAQGMSNATLQFMPWFGFVVVLMNQYTKENRVLASLPIRQAIFKCIDKVAIQKATWNGEGEILVTALPSYDPNFYNPAGPGVITPPDIPGAQALMQSAGYSASNPLNLTLETVVAPGLDQPTDSIIQAAVQPAYINLTINAVSLTQWVADVQTNQNFDIAMHQLSWKGDPTITVNRWVGPNGPNFTTYDSPTIEAAIAASAVDTGAARMADFKTLQTEMYNNVAFIPLIGNPEPALGYNYLSGEFNFDQPVVGYDFRKAYTSKK